MIFGNMLPGEMPFLHIAGHGGNIHPIERLLLRFAKVNTHFFDASGDHKNVGVNFTGQQRDGGSLSITASTLW